MINFCISFIRGIDRKSSCLSWKQVSSYEKTANIAYRDGVFFFAKNVEEVRFVLFVARGNVVVDCSGHSERTKKKPRISKNGCVRKWEHLR